MAVPGFKDWLVLDEKKPYSVFCKVCIKTLDACYKSNLEKHTRSDTHRENCEKKNIPVILGFNLPKINEIRMEDAVPKLKFAALHPDMNWAFQNCQITAKKLGNIDSKSVFKTMNLGPTQAKDMVVNVISPCIKQDFSNF